MARPPACHSSSGPGTQEAPGHCSLTHHREDTGGWQPLLGLGHAALPRSERTPCRLSARNPEDPGLLSCDLARHPARVSTQGPLPALSW